MNKIQSIRDKYQKRHAASGRLFFPPGGADIMRLCDISERLLAIVRELQHAQDTAGQNETERKLWVIL